MASNTLFRMDDKNSNSGVQTVGLKCPLYSRIGHRAVRFNEEVLIFGGSGPSAEFLKTVLRFNLQNLKIEPISTAACPPLEGFSLFSHKGTVYLWGGTLEAKPCNTLWCYQGGGLVTRKQNGDIPAARAFHCSAQVGDKYLIIYGGHNETEVLNDWHLFNLQTCTWSPLQCNQQLPRNVKFQLLWDAGRGFLLGQYEVVRTGSKTCLIPRNQLYQIRIVSFSACKIRIDCVKDYETQIFSPRFNFTFVPVDRELWVMGGQQLISNKSQQTSVFCNQIWAFSTETLQWVKKPYTLTTKTGFEAIGYKNKLYLFGGLKSSTQMAGSVEIINIRAINLYETQVCNFCKNVYSIDTKSYFPKPHTAFQIQIKDQTEILTQISTNFLSKLSRSLQNPIQAIGLLIDNSLNMGASSLSLSINTPKLSPSYFKQSQSYLYLGDNSRSFAVEEITKILFSFRFKVQKYYRDHIDKEDVKMRNQYGLNLKLAALRLGTSCLFVTLTVEGCVFVAYFSDCETDCPDGDPSFNCFYYSIDQQGVCSNELNRQIIRENVKHMISEKQFLDLKTHSTKVYILGIHDIARSQSRNKKQDISYLHSQGVILSSLTQYASCLYLNPFLGREIYIEQNRVAFVNLVSKFKEDQKNGYIQEIDTSLEVNIFVRISLYRVMKSSYSTNFVYIYHQNRLICTIPSKEKLICGYLEVPSLIEVDFYRTKIERWVEERKLIGYIESKEEPYKRQRKIENYPPQGQIRKLQPGYLQF